MIKKLIATAALVFVVAIGIVLLSAVVIAGTDVSQDPVGYSQYLELSKSDPAAANAIAEKQREHYMEMTFFESLSNPMDYAAWILIRFFLLFPYLLFIGGVVFIISVFLSTKSANTFRIKHVRSE